MDLIYILLALFFGFTCGALASRKGRNGLGWAFLGILFGPIALVVLLFLPYSKIASGASGRRK
jgi:hypothetical protein